MGQLDWNIQCDILIQGYEDMEATALIGHGDYGIYMYWAPQNP